MTDTIKNEPARSFNLQQIDGSMTDQSARIPSLDGLRAISIFLVLLSHLIYTQNFVRPPFFSELQLGSLGPLGVRVFFVISGFLITRLLLQELMQTNTIRLGKFYFRRSLRIFLPYFFFLFVVICLQLAGWANLNSRDYFHAVTYTINYYPNRSWEIGHGWSLSVEEQFYLLWPALLILLGKQKGLWTAFIFMLATPLIRLGYFYFKPSFVEYEIGYRFETAADAIAVGCLLAGIFDWLVRQDFFKRAIKSRLIYLIPLVVLIASQINPTMRRSLLIGIPIQNIGIAIWMLFCVVNSDGFAGKILNARPLVYIGKMSYSIYLWQQLFLNPYSSSWITSFPVNLVFVGIVSFLSFQVIEKPSLEMRKILERVIFLRIEEKPVQSN
jgi:peptidoglycan/LPS O-acetylase OafA/YrhL